MGAYKIIKLIIRVISYACHYGVFRDKKKSPNDPSIVMLILQKPITHSRNVISSAYVFLHNLDHFLQNLDHTRRGHE